MTDDKENHKRVLSIETSASADQLFYRKRLADMFDSSPLSTEDKLFNIGLFTRSSVLVKFLLLSEIYLKIKDIPGQLLEFGTWWGQNLVLLENLRAIHEPFNKQRRIIGFDTFDGYTAPSSEDRGASEWVGGAYNTGAGYVDYLRALLETHEGSNVLGHLRSNHQLIVGNVVETAPKYFEVHPETIVAFAYFDMALYEPTKAALSTIIPHLVPGSIILLDELTWAPSPGEAIAFKEAFRGLRYKIEKVSIYPSKSIVTLLA